MDNTTALWNFKNIVTANSSNSDILNGLIDIAELHVNCEELTNTNILATVRPLADGDSALATLARSVIARWQHIIDISEETETDDEIYEVNYNVDYNTEYLNEDLNEIDEIYSRSPYNYYISDDDNIQIEFDPDPPNPNSSNNNNYTNFQVAVSLVDPTVNANDEE